MIWAGVLVWLAGGFGVLIAGQVWFAKPLGLLHREVERWRLEGHFALGSRRGDPGFRRLAISFKRATLLLTRQRSRLDLAMQQQELLMQEIHHRVKNNLQIVASLLNLQASRIRVPAAQAEFQSARDRVRALATLHRHLYAHGEVHTIDMREFLIELCQQLFAAMGETEGERLTLAIAAPQLRMSSDQAVPLSLIVTEAVSNAVKYAFPGGRRGNIAIALHVEGETARLEITDDGVGIPAGRVQTEAGIRDGIGLQLIRGFAKQLGATLEVEEGGGTRYVVTLKLRRERFVSPDLGPAAESMALPP